MANNFKSDQSEDEYRASDPDSSSTSVFATATSAADKPHILERLKRKNILIAVGVVVAVFVIYKMLDVLFTPGSHKQSPVVSPAPMVAAPQAMTVAGPQQPPVASAAIENRIAALEQQVTGYQAGIDKINSQITDMQTTLSSLGSRLDEVNSSLQGMATQMAQQQAALAAKEAAQRKAKMKQYTAPKTIYFVRAMVPGRAWLATGDGRTVTIGLGDNLPGYGIVQVIDPNQGTITTNTGAIIGYSPSEK